MEWWFEGTFQSQICTLFWPPHFINFIVMPMGGDELSWNLYIWSFSTALVWNGEGGIWQFSSLVCYCVTPYLASGRVTLLTKWLVKQKLDTFASHNFVVLWNSSLVASVQLSIACSTDCTASNRRLGMGLGTSLRKLCVYIFAYCMCDSCGFGCCKGETENCVFISF